jgi:ABC-2 type transport system permease protein
MAETIELSRPRMGNTISEAVKDGSIAYFLNKPYNFILYHYSATMGETLVRALINILLGGSFVWWLVGAPPTAAGWPFVAIAALGAWTLNFCIATMIGLASFVIEDISAFQWIYQKLAFIFGGLLIPLDFYPRWLQILSSALPFSSITYAPARLFVTPSLAVFASVLGVQLAWLLVFGMLLALAYQRGISRITINGG